MILTKIRMGSNGGLDYASRLKPRAEKGGGMGEREHYDQPEETAMKILHLAEMLASSRHCVVM
jgi:hypothetical protein